MSTSYESAQSDALFRSTNINSTPSAASAGRPSPSIQQWTCPCLNVRLSLAPGSAPSSSSATNGSRSPWLAELASDNAIHVQFPSLTARETVSLAESTNIACAKCLNCNTVVYAASKPAPLGPARALGFNTANSINDAAKEVADGPVSPSGARQYSSPSREKADRSSSRANEPLVRPLDRKIWILPDVLSPQQASSVHGSEAFSPAFNVVVPRGNAASTSGSEAHRATSDNIRDATPTRPAAGAGTRQSSYGSGSSNIAYALPAVPQHLISSPPTSPRVGTSSSANAASISAGVPSSPASLPLGSSSNSYFTANPLASQLDSVAIERLKDMRTKAEAEVFELVRQKRREMELLEKRFREEAESLLAVTKTPRQSKSNNATNGSTASLIEKALLDQQQQQPQALASQRRSSVASSKQNTIPTTSAPSGAVPTRSTGSSASRENSTAQSSLWSSHRRDSLIDEYSDLPPSAFERRPTYATPVNTTATTSTSNGGVPNNVASSLGGLSASFAMRGRELPAQMQDWAEKRRLRERYPQGDHSALPSAANSNATSAANSIADSEEDAWLAQAGNARAQERTRVRESSAIADEEDSRGRGRQPSRQRGDSSSREPREPRQPQPSNAENRSDLRKDTGRGRSGRPSGRNAFNPPPLMSSSLLTKRPALAYVDDGRDADEDTPSVGDKLISPQSVAEPSAQVTLRPRGPPPSTAEPLKPATRSTAGSGDDGKSGGRGRASAPAASSSHTSSQGTGHGLDSPRSRKAPEKKVAFAETEDRVDHTVALDEYDEDGDEDDVDGSVQQANGTLITGRVRNPSLPLVDEAADAVFEIDEEAEDAEVDDDGTLDAEEATPEESDRLKIEMSQSGLRTGASGRPRGQADDTLPGFEDDAVAAKQASDRRGPSSGSLSDDLRSSSDDEDQVPAGFGAASFSALAASQSAMHSLASHMARAGADDSGFDPASLRIDGRVVVPPPSTSARDLEVEPEAFVVGSLRSSSRRMSVQLTPNGPSGEGADADTGRVASSGTRRQRSPSRTRISNMSKEDADTEVRLSGLLAPNAPSHRSLWSPKEAKARRAGKNKYKLDEEDNQKWDLWKRKVGSGSPSIANPQTATSDAEAKDGARSTPMAVAPPTQYIAAGSGIGPRPLREATMIDPDYPDNAAAFSAFDRHLQARTIAAATAATAAGGGVQIGKRTWGYGSFKDDTSGFEVEPKTSLPYKEKMMVPSLRKAVRRSIFEPEPSTKLETIPDAEDGSSSVSAGNAEGAASSAAAARPIARESQANTERELKGALPGSVITRGFHMPGAQIPKQALASASAPAVPSMGTGLGLPSVTTSGGSTVTPAPGLQAAAHDASVGPSLPNSGTATPTSMGRRSPRPPYVAPPPPTSATTVLVSDPAQAPRPLKLFQVPADTSFRLHEEGEDPETEEGWSKVLKFMHVVEQLKTNKRTGWLHHRVPRPESIADHMYRMAILSLLCPAEADVDLGKCVQLAVVHDLAEAEVGDLTPLDGVGKEEKMRREKEAIQYFVHDLLGSSAAGLRIEALWEEYEARESKESKLVKDLDRFELGLQAVEYERREGIDDLQGFWEGSIPHVSHPRIRRWAMELAQEREELWRSRGREYTQEIKEDEPTA